MNLYQYAFGHQPHYIVAESFGDAEDAINRAGYSCPDTIECLGPYVLVSTRALRYFTGADDPEPIV